MLPIPFYLKPCLNCDLINSQKKKITLIAFVLIWNLKGIAQQPRATESAAFGIIFALSVATLRSTFSIATVERTLTSTIPLYSRCCFFFFSSELYPSSMELNGFSLFCTFETSVANPIPILMVVTLESPGTMDARSTLSERGQLLQQTRLMHSPMRNAMFALPCSSNARKLKMCNDANCLHARSVKLRWFQNIRINPLK